MQNTASVLKVEKSPDPKNQHFKERAAIARERRSTQRAVNLQHKAFAPISYREVARMPIGRDWLITLIDLLIAPLSLVVSLFGVALFLHGAISSSHLLLAVVVFSLTFRGQLHLSRTIWGVARHIAASWLLVSSVLFVLGWVTGTLQYFDTKLLLIWWVAAPVTQFAGQLLFRYSQLGVARLQGPPTRAVVVGVNQQSIELARRMGDSNSHMDMVGFFDDRPVKQVEIPNGYPVLGKLPEMPRFVNENNIDVIYISLPMYSQPRILALLDALRDTTASIYFVPDLFVTDLIQGRVDSVHGLPVVAVCETPFTGLVGISKRLSDIVFSLFFLILLSPLLLAIAIGVKMTSPGPVIFKQRRYGLDGKGILVYKFRSMTVTEDGDVVKQASKNDSRVTPFGAFLRKTSLDELPQFVNVLQGRMSVVGPRPHAVAHNEMYRKLITGYMVRHKVRPGITGWAQVNGFRGETEELHKMKARVDYDLDYLRNWSLGLDTYIIAKTVWVVFKGNNAY